MNAIIYKTKNLDRKVSELHSWPPLQQDLIDALFSSWDDVFQLLLDFNRKPKQFVYLQQLAIEIYYTPKYTLW